MSRFETTHIQTKARPIQASARPVLLGGTSNIYGEAKVLDVDDEVEIYGTIPVPGPDSVIYLEAWASGISKSDTDGTFVLNLNGVAIARQTVTAFEYFNLRASGGISVNDDFSLTLTFIGENSDTVVEVTQIGWSAIVGYGVTPTQT